MRKDVIIGSYRISYVNKGSKVIISNHPGANWSMAATMDSPLFEFVAHILEHKEEENYTEYFTLYMDALLQLSIAPLTPKVLIDFLHSVKEEQPKEVSDEEEKEIITEMKAQYIEAEGENNGGQQD